MERACKGPELREAFLLCLELIGRFSLTPWLADDRLMESIEPADLDWSLQVHVPAMAKSSLLRMARLPSYLNGRGHERQRKGLCRISGSTQLPAGGGGEGLLSEGV
jgi:hypothetical protein